MKVIVDTPIWSYALRSKRKGFEAHVQELEALISDQRVIMFGPARQEILSGYSDKTKFEKLNSKLKYFEIRTLWMRTIFKRQYFQIYVALRVFKARILTS